jgi:hypothetical protein
VPTCPRYGHSLQSYKDKIYVFGGMLKAKKMKNLTNDVNIYNTCSDIYISELQMGLNKHQQSDDIAPIQSGKLHCREVYGNSWGQ